MTESQYTILKQFTRTFIDLSISQGKELKLEDIDYYINQAVMLSKLDCDEAAKTRLFIDMEYEYKIVHNKGKRYSTIMAKSVNGTPIRKYRTISFGQDTRIILSTILLSAVLALTCLTI